MSETFNLEDLKVGLVIGLSEDNQVVFSPFGKVEASNYMELLGLAQTAVDLVKHYRDQGIPSAFSALRTLLLEFRGLEYLRVNAAKEAQTDA